MHPQAAKRSYLHENASKANFTNVYNLSTPHEYFRAMRAVDYQVPDRAAPFYRLILAHLEHKSGSRAPRIIDLGCSYGILSSLLKYDLSFRVDLAEHYAEDASSPDLHTSITRDLSYLEARPLRHPIEMIGIDVADQAISYALETRLLAQGLASDLERGQPVPICKLTDIDLIISTGCIGYPAKNCGRTHRTSKSPG